MNKLAKLKYKLPSLLAIFFVIGGILTRLAPHPSNFTPITAAALFGGVYLSKRSALLIPLVAMIISDYLLFPQAMFHSTTLYVWGSFMISGLIGLWLKKRQKPHLILGASLVASLQFFLITNFGVWTTGMYSRDISGLFESYLMGLPFYKFTLLGDLFYTSCFFGLYRLVLWSFKCDYPLVLLKGNMKKVKNISSS